MPVKLHNCLWEKETGTGLFIEIVMSAGIIHASGLYWLRGMSSSQSGTRLRRAHVGRWSADVLLKLTQQNQTGATVRRDWQRQLALPSIHDSFCDVCSSPCTFLQVSLLVGCFIYIKLVMWTVVNVDLSGYVVYRSGYTPKINRYLGGGFFREISISVMVCSVWSGRRPRHFRVYPSRQCWPCESGRHVI